MIITLTANPSLDRAVTLTTDLIPGDVHRIAKDQTQPGGKGINVAIGAQQAGLDTLAILPSADDDPLLALLDRTGLPYRASRIDGRVRTNITVLGGGVTTKINEPGDVLSDSEVAALEETLISSVHEGDTVMLSGSLAPGFPADEYARLIRRLRPLGVWVGVDTSDAPLAALAENFNDAAPNFLKPNAEELGQLTGRDGDALEAAAAVGDLTAVREAAVALHELGVDEVLVTLGGAGAVLATAEGVWFAPSPYVNVVSTVGAGDSATAGYLIARAAGLIAPARLAQAVAYGAVAVSLPGTTIPKPEQVQPDSNTVVSI